MGMIGLDGGKGINNLPINVINQFAKFEFGGSFVVLKFKLMSIIFRLLYAFVFCYY